ncbi:MAG: hypothetical protein ACREJD_13815 [Phycisphaerales bacterium]
MSSRPPNSDSFQTFEAHALRLEGRKLIQACLDREISEDSPRLRALLARDAQLRQEFEEFRQLDGILMQPAGAVDLSAKILADLQNRPVFLPAQSKKRSSFAGFGIGLAASLAIGAGTIWITLAGLHSPPPLQSLAQSTKLPDLLGDAREAIRNITGMTLAQDSPQHSPISYVIAPVAESSQLPDIDSITSANDADPRQLANQMAGTGAVRIERSGLCVVNPGPDRTPAPSRHTRAAVLEWNTQPNAMYNGGKSRRSDVYQTAAVTGWYDKEGTYVPVTGAGSPK